MKTKWFKLRIESHRWWHWVIRPAQTYRLKKWLEHVEDKLHKEMDVNELHEQYHKTIVDMMCFGHSVVEVKEKTDD